MGDEGQRPAGLEQIWTVWNRRRWLALVSFLLPLSAAISLVAFLPYVYKSTALILVDRQQVPEELVRSTVTSALETRLRTISEEILSRNRLEGLIARFGLYRTLRGNFSTEELVERMRRDIKLELKSAEAQDRRATVAFTISYRGADPDQVAAVTNTLASFYIEENLKVRGKQATGTADFLRAELVQVKEKLDEQEKKVSEFKKRYVGELPQELEVNLATLERLNAQLRLNNDSQARVLERRQALTRQLTDMGVVTGSADTGVSAVDPPDPLTLKIAQLRQELAELRTRFSDKYPDVVRMRAEITLLEKDLAERKASPKSEGKPVVRPFVPPDPQIMRMRQAVDEVEAEVKILKAEEERLRSSIGLYQRRVQETPAREQQYRELGRDYDSTKEYYASLLKRHSEAQLAESMEHRQKGEQFRVLDPALPSSSPAAPNRSMLLLVGLVGSAGLAVVAVVLAESLDNSFHAVKDLKGFTSVPILVSIPRIVGDQDLRARRRKFQIAAVAVVLAVVVLSGLSYAVARNESIVARITGTS